MTEDEFNTLTPAEREMLRIVTGAIADVMQYLERINLKLDELAGTRGTLVFGGKSTAELLQLYDAMRATHPGLTKAKFAKMVGVPANRLYVAKHRTKGS